MALRDSDIEYEGREWQAQNAAAQHAEPLARRLDEIERRLGINQPETPPITDGMVQALRDSLRSTWGGRVSAGPEAEWPTYGELRAALGAALDAGEEH